MLSLAPTQTPIGAEVQLILPPNHSCKFNSCTKQHNDQKESCLFSPAELITVFEPILRPQKTAHYVPKQFRVAPAKARDDLGPAQSQLVLLHFFEERGTNLAPSETNP